SSRASGSRPKAWRRSDFSFSFRHPREGGDPDTVRRYRRRRLDPCLRRGDGQIGDLTVMGKETGFLEFEREDRGYADPAERLAHYKEFVVPLPDDKLRNQAARCMNCGIPYCHTGCPVNNLIPDWNHLVYEADWKRAL